MRSQASAVLLKNRDHTACSSPPGAPQAAELGNCCTRALRASARETGLHQLNGSFWKTESETGRSIFIVPLGHKHYNKQVFGDCFWVTFCNRGLLRNFTSSAF